MTPLSPDSDRSGRRAHYRQVRTTIESLLANEDDWIAAMATVACELHHSFTYYHWTGFYRAVGGDVLVIGPYQGSHGCLRIEYNRGVCGKAARELCTQRVANVADVTDHIACSATTQSEIVVPIVRPDGGLLAVLDVDSDSPAAFSDVDQSELEVLCGQLGHRFANATTGR